MPDIREADVLLGPLLVVEIGHRIAVGACGGLLAQLGADVVVIEPAVARSDGKWRNRAAMVAGKQSLVIDHESPADEALRRELLSCADVVLLSGDDGISDAGLWDAPRPPSQIMCDLTAFGHDGPLAGQGGSEAIVAALSGVLDTTGPADGAPLVIGAPVLEMSASVFAAAAIVTALRVRRLHGVGQRIDIAIFDVAVNELANFLPMQFEGQPTTRSGNRHPLNRPWGSYRARDGHVLICAVSTEHFARICKAIGAPELATDVRFATSGARLTYSGEMDRHIEAWTGERTVDECVAHLLPLGVACGAIVPVDRLHEERNIVHRRSIRMLDAPMGHRTAVPASPLRGVPAQGRSPSSIPVRDGGRSFLRTLLDQRGARAGTARVTGDARSAARPLAGVRVVEIGQHTVAPLASRHLGALGADVIKIESPSGDAIRRSAPLRADGLAHIFALSNTDKRGLVLDLRVEAQREMLHGLLAQTDVLIENMRPGALAKLGFGGDVLRARHPRLIYCPINGFGNDSAYPGRPAFDTITQAMSGLMSATLSEGAPMKAGISVSDMLGGEFGLLASLAALEYRERTGAAVHFDLAMQDSTTWMTQMVWAGSAPAEPVVVRRAVDGYIVAMATPEQLDAAIGGGVWSGERSALQSALAQSGIKSAPVLTVREVATCAQVAARELLIRRPTSDGDTWTVLGSPMRLLSTPALVRTVMPRLGAEDAIVILEFALREPPVGESTSLQHQPGEVQ